MKRLFATVPGHCWPGSKVNKIQIIMPALRLGYAYLPRHDSWHISINTSHGEKYAKVPHRRIVMKPHDRKTDDANERVYLDDKGSFSIPIAYP